MLKILLFAFLIGFFAGLRSLLAPATVAWGVYMGWLRLERPLALIGSVPSVIVFTILAIVELIGDKLPKTPSRTSAIGLIARIVTGGLTGACISSAAGGPIIAGACAGAAGGILGCYAGFHARTYLTKSMGIRDLYVALVVDLIALAGCLWIL